MERHILRERTSSHISFREPGVSTFAPPCKLVWDASDRLRVPRSTVILSTLSKSDRIVLITWSPSGYTHVVPECPDVQSYSCLLIRAWQLVKAHEVTRNELKIHVICDITISSSYSLSCCAADTDFPGPLTIPPGILVYSLCPYRADVDKF